MERMKQESPESLVELGTASTDTQGGMGSIIEAAGLWHKIGLEED